MNRDVLNAKVRLVPAGAERILDLVYLVDEVINLA